MDVSIRPGWFYHQAEDDKVKSVDTLVDIYEQSVGRGANLLLNIPPDRRGLIPDIDAARLREFGRVIADTYRTDLAPRAAATSPRVRGYARQFAAINVNDGSNTTYWATDDNVTTGSVELAWSAPVTLDRIVLQEAIVLGQRVEGWTAEAEVEGSWKPIAQGTTIGHKRIARVAPVTTRRLRITITRAVAAPTLSTVGVYGR